jgi:ABC-type uncharacterized transport system substrate-binding protein
MNMLTETMEPKRLGIFRELLPHAQTIAVLVNPMFPPAEMQSREIEDAARTVGVSTHLFRASADNDIDAAMSSIVQQKFPALIVATDPFFVSRRENLIALALRHKLPTIYGFRDLAVSGGLVSYGIDLADVYRQQALYVSRILKGAQPADLPVLQPTKFELVINLKTAKALSLDIPATLLATADEVIE